MKCTHTYHVSQVTSNIFMTNFMLEPGSLLHLGNCHLCNSTQKWMENSGCSVSCAMLPFYLRGLTPAEAHIERICIFSSHPQGSWLLTIHSKASQAFRLRPVALGQPWRLSSSPGLFTFSVGCRNTSRIKLQGYGGISQIVTGRCGMHRLSDGDNWEMSMWTLVFILLPQLFLYPLACDQVW